MTIGKISAILQHDTEHWIIAVGKPVNEKGHDGRGGN